MIEKLKQFMSSALGADTESLMADAEQQTLLAAVALMIEIIAVDDAEHEAEKAMLRQILSSRFNTGAEAADKLIAEAEAAHNEATDFYRFTAEINDTFSAEQKIELIEHLWQLAYADDHLHELEQHVIRKLASLLYVSHKDFIAAKLRVAQART
jgi:uncharacterized tellurite resistance protein B-like protein